MATSFEAAHPPIAHFVNAFGWIEAGHDDDSPLTSFIRAIDSGGMVWEGKDAYQTLDEAFQDLESGVENWMREQGTAYREERWAAYGSYGIEQST
jgi:hypothetical protein